MHPQPGLPDRPVRRADAGGPRLVRPDAGQQRARTSTSRLRSSSVSQPGAAPNEIETQVTQRVEFGDPRRQRRRRNQQHRERGQQPRPSSTSSSARRPTARSTMSATRSPRSAAICPRASSSRRSTRVDAENEPISYVGAQTTDMTPRAAELVHRQHRRQAPARSRRALPRCARWRRRPRRSASILDPAALQAQGITAAQVNQQLRQSNMNAAGGRAEIAGSEQSVRVHRQRPERLPASQTQIALAGRPLREARRPRPGQGQQCRAALDLEDERPPGRHLPGPARQGFVRGHRL